jgi:hypothetical protein
MSEIPQADPSAKRIELPVPAGAQEPLPREPRSIETVAPESRQPLATPPQEYHTRFGEEVHQYIREYIRNADQKAASFFAAATAILALLSQRNTAVHWLKPVLSWRFLDGVAFLAMVGLAVSACVFLIVIFPRVKGSRRGILFFNAIAEHISGRDYAEEVLRQSVTDLTHAKLQHAYDLARICRTKYFVLHVGFWIGSVSTVFALLYLLLT